MKLASFVDIKERTTGIETPEIHQDTLLYTLGDTRRKGTEEDTVKNTSWNDVVEKPYAIGKRIYRLYEKNNFPPPSKSVEK